jgi:hypothetical protein
MEQDDTLRADGPGRFFIPGEPATFNLVGRHGRNPVVWLLGLPVRVVKLVVLGVKLQRHTRQQRDEIHPGGFLECSPRITELTELALTLALQGREDDAAVQLVRDKAGRHRKDLRWAAATVRARDWITEDRTTDRANQLLLAAVEDRSVEPITDDQEAWFTQVAGLSDGWSEAAFARLVALQPKLADVDRSITQAWREVQDADLQGRERSRARGAVWRQIGEALDPLVGPNAHAADPLVRSHRAHELAERILDDREKASQAVTPRGPLTGHYPRPDTATPDRS